MQKKANIEVHDFKGLGFSKIGHFKEVRSKIKELEKLNIKLAQRHNRLEAIFNSMSDGLTILDRNLNIVFVNEVQKTMFPDITLVGKKCFTAYYRKNKQCRNCPAQKTVNTKGTFRGEALVKTGEFAGRYYEWTTSPIKDPYGKVDEILLLMRDITDRKEYDFKLMQADRMAAIGFLAAGIAHEINNPLTSIAGFSEGLIKRLRNVEEIQGFKEIAAFREYLEIIQNEAYRCKSIIQNLQEFSHSSSDDYETISIVKIINDTVSLIRQQAKDNNIQIMIHNDLATGFNAVIGNESQLKHLFLNLFNNAFKAMQDGGKLSVTAKNDGNMIDVLISDTGSGCLRPMSDNIFNPASALKPPEETTLDLSICYNIIKHHKGEIRFANFEGQGAAFNLRFPAKLP
jgi:PAS domain S-box-containing protein